MSNLRRRHLAAITGRILLAVLCLSPLPLLAQRQVYKDPTGTYSVSVPKGWEAQPQAGSPMVSIVNAGSKVSVTLGVMRGPQTNTPTAESQLQNLEKQFPQTCPQAKVEQRGSAPIAGVPGAFVVVHCTMQDGPETMKLSAATKPGIVAIIVTASPGNAYLKEMIPLEEIKSSIRILGQGAGQGGGVGQRQNQGMGGQGMGGPGTSGQGMGGGQSQAAGDMGQAGGGFPAPAGADSGGYHDPQGRYSLAVPSGWNTSSDNGNLTLSSGAAWVAVNTGSAGSPSDESHSVLQQIEAQYKNFQILNQGDFQNNGHPAHGTNATGVNPKGERVSLLVVSIGAGGSNYLVLISSAPNDQAKQINGTVMQIAQSVRFAGE